MSSYIANVSRAGRYWQQSRCGEKKHGRVFRVVFPHHTQKYKNFRAVYVYIPTHRILAILFSFYSPIYANFNEHHFHPCFARWIFFPIFFLFVTPARFVCMCLLMYILRVTIWARCGSLYKSTSAYNAENQRDMRKMETRDDTGAKKEEGNTMKKMHTYKIFRADVSIYLTCSCTYSVSNCFIPPSYTISPTPPAC